MYTESLNLYTVAISFQETPENMGQNFVIASFGRKK